MTTNTKALTDGRQDLIDQIAGLATTVRTDQCIELLDLALKAAEIFTHRPNAGSKFFVNTTFEGRFPVGTAAVVRALDAEKAAAILNSELKESGLAGGVEAWQMTCLSDAKEDGAIILCDGDY